MAYAIITKDKAGALELRQEHRAAHLEHLMAHLGKLIAAGAQIEDDGSGGFGGIILFDTDDRAEAEAFVAADPFTKVGLFEEVTVVRWRKGFLDGKRLF
ncbi:MAG: YciI family protein [Pseudomonadota bacterium]